MPTFYKKPLLKLGCTRNAHYRKETKHLLIQYQFCYILRTLKIRFSFFFKYSSIVATSITLRSMIIHVRIKVVSLHPWDMLDLPNLHLHNSRISDATSLLPCVATICLSVGSLHMDKRPSLRRSDVIITLMQTYSTPL